jgi:hypothetical protein
MFGIVIINHVHTDTVDLKLRRSYLNDYEYEEYGSIKDK